MHKVMALSISALTASEAGKISSVFLRPQPYARGDQGREEIAESGVGEPQLQRGDAGNSLGTPRVSTLDQLQVARERLTYAEQDIVQCVGVLDRGLYAVCDEPGFGRIETSCCCRAGRGGVRTWQRRHRVMRRFRGGGRGGLAFQ